MKMATDEEIIEDFKGCDEDCWEDETDCSNKSFMPCPECLRKLMALAREEGRKFPHLPDGQCLSAFEKVREEGRKEGRDEERGKWRGSNSLNKRIAELEADNAKLEAALKEILPCLDSSCRCLGNEHPYHNERREDHNCRYWELYTQAKKALEG